jgi:hypothetical protein
MVKKQQQQQWMPRAADLCKADTKHYEASSQYFSGEIVIGTIY